jgi:hypothetical protein
LVFVFLGVPAFLQAQLMTQLSPEAGRDFDSYVKAAEAKLDGTARVTLEKPGVSVVPGAAQSTVDLKGAILHDWTGAVMIPGATVEHAIAVLQGYDEYKRVYAPDVTDSKVIARQGNRWRVSLSLYRFLVFAANYNTEYDVEYRPLGAGRWLVLSRSIKVAERYGGKELTPGTGHGYLWRLNAYWLLEQRPEGLYMECRSISLSRDIPVGLGWAVRPMVTTLPRQSLEDTLKATVRALTP